MTIRRLIVALAAASVTATGLAACGPDGTSAQHTGWLVAGASASPSSSASPSASASQEMSPVPAATATVPTVAPPSVPTTGPAGKNPTPGAPHTTTKPPAPKTTPPAPPAGKPVTPGAFCSPEGAIGYTSAGTLMQCIRKPGEARARWRKP
ncbi:hypothetical protein [Dactylosporangium darangshiense]|uniref:hypothetical protein n=1 Tax=Dactylosporangium darangshiense TaxID=579108 RepID=UPI0031E567B8